MANFVCDICGGKLTMQSGGIGVCSQCGMEYSNERLREMAGAAPAQAEVKSVEAPAPKEDSKIKNYLKIAENELNAGFYRDTKKALEYCDKVLEIDFDNFDAWYLKAKLELSCNQYSDALRYGVELYRKENLVGDQKNKSIALIKEAIDSWLGSYMGTAWSIIVPDIACLADVEDGRVYVEVIKKVLRGLREQLLNAEKRVDEFKAKEYMWKTEYSAHSDGDFVLREVRSVVDTMSKIPEKMHAKLAGDMLKEYKEALRVYNRLKEMYYDGGDYFEDKKKKDPSSIAIGAQISDKISQMEDIERAERRRLEELARLERIRLAEAYWSQHPEEKKSLEDELERVAKEWAAAEEGLNEFLEENPKEIVIEEQILDCKKELNELSLFNMKDRKVVKETIKELEKKLKDAEDEFLARKSAQIKKVDELEAMHEKISRKLERV